MKIKEELKRAGLTQRAAAQELGISEFRISRVLTGKFRARPRERRRIARVLGVPVGKLFRRRRRRARA
jgi:transcriptional regulator with XRE-family HTH domain